MSGQTLGFTHQMKTRFFRPTALRLSPNECPSGGGCRECYRNSIGIFRIRRGSYGDTLKGIGSGFWLPLPQRISISAHTGAGLIKTAPQPTNIRGDVRSALLGISRNAQVSGIIGVELIVLAVFLGWYFHSILFGAAMLGRPSLDVEIPYRHNTSCIYSYRGLELSRLVHRSDRVSRIGCQDCPGRRGACDWIYDPSTGIRTHPRTDMSQIQMINTGNKRDPPNNGRLP